MAKSNPWIYIPTLYFAEGLPYTVVMMMSAVYFKDIGIDNDTIGMMKALSFPWLFKFAWAPLIDMYGQKKRWIVVAQVVLTACFALFGLTCFASNPFRAAMPVLALLAIVSATHDSSIDGYYLEVLDKSRQALFVGVRNTAYRLSMIFGTGAMVYLAGEFSTKMSKTTAWCISFEIIAAVMFLAFILHSLILPAKTAGLNVEKDNAVAVPVAVSALASESTPASQNEDVSATNDDSVLDKQAEDGSAADEVGSRNYIKAIFSYFKQPGIVAIVLFVLLFRLGEAMAVPMITPFLQDAVEKGGMALSLKDVGTIYGTVGVGFLLLGGIVGGYLVSKQGLKRWFWPSTLIMNGTIVFYWLLALNRPSEKFWIYVVNSVEQFGYGFGMAAYTVFLLSTVNPKYKAGHYAIATALMALGVTVPGMVSGKIQTAIGYSNFFLLSFCLTVPGIISLFFLPIWRKEEKIAT